MIGSKFRCNICGTNVVFNPEGDWREGASCTHCGSSVRMRSIIHVLTLELLGVSSVLPDLSPMPMAGAGLSDWDGYSARLSEIFDYTNTYYHQAPQLDITEPGDEWIGTCDFLISTDVFEHVPNPAARAFSGSFAVLRPGGVLVLTVPYGDNPATIEHYPDMAEFGVTQVGDQWVCVVRTRAGALYVDPNPIFHGGPGTTIEMRIFSLTETMALMEAAGFVDVRLHSEPYAPFGVFPPHGHGLPISGRKPLAA